MNKSVKSSPDVRERAVRMVLEHQHEHDWQWAAISAMAGKIGCTAETLRSGVCRAEWDQGLRPGKPILSCAHGRDPQRTAAASLKHLGRSF